MRKDFFNIFVIPLFLFSACGHNMEEYGAAVLFRGDPQRQGRSETPGPLTKPGSKWKFQTNGEIWSTPVPAQGMLFFGSNDKCFYAVDAGSGKERWRFETGGMVRSSAAVVYGMVFFDSYDGYVYALDAGTGKQVWRFDLLKDAGQENHNAQFFQWDDYTSSPLVDNGMLYIGARNNAHCLFALDAFSGNLKWSFDPDEVNLIRSSPAVFGDTLYVGSEYNKFYALDKNNGSLKWEVKTDGIVNYGPAIDNKGTVYFACKDRRCYAVNGSSGEVIWKSLLAPENATWLTGFPALGDKGLLYVGSSDYHRLLALEAGTGKTAWEFDAHGWVWSSPLYAQGIVYLAGGDTDKVFALDAGSGKELWNFETGGALYGSPAVADGVLYIGSADGTMYALE